MSIELPPGGLGKGPHAGAPVPRLHLEVTVAEKLAMEPVIQRMRDLVNDNVGVGGFDCPACRQLVTIYRTPVSRNAAQLLLLLYLKYGSTEPFHLRHDGQTLWGVRNLPVEIWLFPWFGLLSPHVLPETRERDDGSLYEVDVEQPGEYYISRYAEGWIRRHYEIPIAALTYNGRVLGLDKTLGMGIEAGVGYEFDLETLQDADPGDRRALLLRGHVAKRPRLPRRK